MEKEEFKSYRKQLKKTQKQIAEILGISIKAIHSYEQGWRSIPGYIERQLFFLICSKKGDDKRKACWEIKKCPDHYREQCPAYEFQCDKLCWFINGTICEGKSHHNWHEKFKICRECEVFKQLL